MVLLSSCSIIDYEAFFKVKENEETQKMLEVELTQKEDKINLLNHQKGNGHLWMVKEIFIVENR